MVSEKNSADSLGKKIKSAFPDEQFNGRITGVDGLPNEELDEQKSLYDALHGKKWSEIPQLLIQTYPDGIALLTDEAFSVFLPAWLICALTRDEVREMLIYLFSPVDQTMLGRMNRRVQLLTLVQKQVLGMFLAYCADAESSTFARKRANIGFELIAKLASH